MVAGEYGGIRMNKFFLLMTEDVCVFAPSQFTVNITMLRVATRFHTINT